MGFRKKTQQHKKPRQQSFVVFIGNETWRKKKIQYASVKQKQNSKLHYTWLLAQ